MLVRLLAVCGSLLFAGSAHAFCRTHTADPTSSMCPDACEELGLPLAWSTPDLHYAFHVSGFPNLEDADLRRIVAQSAAAWEEVSCGDRPIGITLEPDALPTEHDLGHTVRGPNVNAIAYLSAAQWAEYELGHAAYATTKVWFNTKTGEILGADMLFNASMGSFGECADTGCTKEGPRVDLRNVATHEFGHFLGLAHSEKAGKAMSCGAWPEDVSKRHLQDDDIEGLCTIYPPGEAFMEPPRKRPKSDGCRLGPGASGGWLLISLLLRRRRRIRTSAP